MNPQVSLMQQMVSGFVKLNFSVDDAIRQTEELLQQHNLGLCSPETSLAEFYKQCSRFRQVTETRFLRLPKILEKLPTDAARAEFCQKVEGFVNHLTIDYCNALISMCNLYMKRGITSARKMHDQMQQTREIASRLLTRHRDDMQRCFQSSSMHPSPYTPPAQEVSMMNPYSNNQDLAPFGNGPDPRFGSPFPNFRSRPPFANGFNHRQPFHGFRPRQQRFNNRVFRPPSWHGGNHTIESLSKMMQTHQDLFEKVGTMVETINGEMQSIKQKLEWFEGRLKNVEAACGIEPEPEPIKDESMEDPNLELPDPEDKPEENHEDNEENGTNESGEVKQEDISLISFLGEEKNQEDDQEKSLAAEGDQEKSPAIEGEEEFSFVTAQEVEQSSE